MSTHDPGYSSSSIDYAVDRFVSSQGQEQEASETKRSLSPGNSSHLVDSYLQLKRKAVGGAHVSREEDKEGASFMDAQNLQCGSLFASQQFQETMIIPVSG